ncbi:MAG: type II secretion system protein [Sulfurimonas sp.]|jgi:prepilin-type N-terminal cleavage/methylation domain-containing protein
MNANKQRKAFTFIELLFVIVILGIVGGMTLEAVRQYYNGIYRTQEIMKRTETADHVLDQLKNYFEYALADSIVNLDKQGAANACYGPPVPNDSGDYTVAFVAADEDSLRTTGSSPGWSSEVQLNAVANTITEQDANFTAADGIVQGLGSTLADSAIYKKNKNDINLNLGDIIGCVRFNLNVGDGIGGYHRISAVDLPNNRLTLNTEYNVSDGHLKYLLRTGYAFRVDHSNGGNFYMYTNFRPWKGERYDQNGTKNLLAEKVNHLYLSYNMPESSSSVGTVITLKVCMQGLDENLSDSDDDTLQICRERSVHVRY